MRNCKVCGTLFDPPARASTLCSDECRDIQKIESKRKWRTKTPEHRKVWSGYTNTWRQNNKIRAKVTHLRAKAKASNLPFDLDESDIVVPTHCPVLGVPMDGKSRDFVWSVDRLIPELGYVKSNIRIISLKANRIKSNATVEDLEKIIEYIGRALASP